MKAIKIIGGCAAGFALLCLTGFDCPECNFKAQITALLVSTAIAVVCGLIVAKKEE